jgi:hypothetical protein
MNVKFMNIMNTEWDIDTDKDMDKNMDIDMTRTWTWKPGIVCSRHEKYRKVCTGMEIHL